MAISGTGLALVGAGSLFVYAGITGKSVLATLYSIVSGNNPAGVAQAYPINSGNTIANATALQNASGTGTSALGTAAGAGALAGAPSGPISNSQEAQAYAFSLFPSYGWDSSQEQPLISLWNQESGWNANAVNQNGGAYGIPQALPSAQGHPYGLGWGNAAAQIKWGLNYIKGRYGSPSAAWAHEVANNWY